MTTYYVATGTLDYNGVHAFGAGDYVPAGHPGFGGWNAAALLTTTTTPPPSPAGGPSGLRFATYAELTKKQDALSDGAVPKYDLKRDFGAKLDGRYVKGSMGNGSAVFTRDTTFGMPFTVADEGKNIGVIGAGAGGANLVTTILHFTDADHITLAAAAGSAVAGAYAPFGTDDTVAVQAAQDAMDADVLALCAGSGVCILAGALQNGNRLQAQVLLRAIPVTAEWRVNGFVGPVVVPVGQANVKLAGVSPKMHQRGLIFQSLADAPGGSLPCVFGTDGNPADGEWEASYRIPVFDGVTIRTLGGGHSAIWGLHTGFAAGHDLGSSKALQIDTVTDFPFVPQPSDSFSSGGYAGPVAGSFGHVRGGVIGVFGYNVGAILPGDHALIGRLLTGFCKIPALTQAGYFGPRIDKWTTYSCPHLIMAGTAGPISPIDIGALQIEDDGYDGTQAPPWVLPVDHLYADNGQIIMAKIGTLIRAKEQVGVLSAPLIRSVASGGRIDCIVDHQFGAAGSVLAIDRAKEINPLSSPAAKVGTWGPSVLAGDLEGGGIFNSTGANGDSITFREVLLSAGTWSLDVAYRAWGGGGAVVFALVGPDTFDESLVIGGSGAGGIDTYAAASSGELAQSVTSFIVPSAGMYRLKAGLVGKNAAAFGYYAVLDDLILTQTA